MSQDSLTVREVSLFIMDRLKDIYEKREIRGITELIFEHLLGYSKTDLLINSNTKLSNSLFFQIKDIAEQLHSHKPIQYVLGYAWFYGIKLGVNPDVLIPRQETEELVKWIIDDSHSAPVQLLEIGTGSGCMAIALALNLPLSHVTATDISAKAIRVAERNASEAGADINLINEDIFDPVIVKSGKFDIIVSNPPYVTESEKRLIDKNVLLFEPVEALFVPDMQALKYYEVIASLATQILNPGGKLFFEFNENKAGEMEELLSRHRFSNTEIRKDISGKFRMVRACFI